MSRFKLIPGPIFFPVILTVFLFGVIIFAVMLPMFEQRLMDGKREMIRELVESAWSSLAVYAQKEASGELNRAEAQARAVNHIRNLRYGEDLKDYFWINDMRPYMIMHPYLPDLDGTDISELKDADDTYIFRRFVHTVQTRGAGYVDYQWQWMDDPNRIVPKISYVKGFAPWNWIIGTGVYVEDVHAHISQITHRLTAISVGTLFLIVVLSSFTMWHSVKVNRAKLKAEEQAALRQEQLFQASKMVAVGTLVSGVAHEINNPITSILLNAPNLDKLWHSVLPILDRHYENSGDFAMGQTSYSRMRDRIPEMLACITKDAGRVRDIVADLKNFARQGPSEMHDKVDLNKIVKQAVGLTANLINKSTGFFTLDSARDLPFFRGNAQRIEQVVINLVVNACQSLPDKQSAIRISTAYDADTHCVVLEVKDEGQGIESSVLKQITDPFFTTKRESGGTGLGLAVTDRIVTDHGGTLQFASTQGKGTTVTVTFPVG